MSGIQYSDLADAVTGALVPLTGRVTTAEVMDRVRAIVRGVVGEQLANSDVREVRFGLETNSISVTLALTRDRSTVDISHLLRSGMSRV